jgi:two-component system, LytTR family, response regulator
MVLTCIIVDDEPLARKLLEHFVQQTEDVEMLGSYDNAQAASEFLNLINCDVDMVFLDLQMRQHTGLDLIDKLKSKSLRYIITSAYPQSFLKEYQTQHFEWLQKPIRYETFLETMEKVRESKKSLNSL